MTSFPRSQPECALVLLSTLVFRPPCRRPPSPLPRTSTFQADATPALDMPLGVIARGDVRGRLAFVEKDVAIDSNAAFAPGSKRDRGALLCIFSKCTRLILLSFSSLCTLSGSCSRLYPTGTQLTAWFPVSVFRASTHHRL